MPAKTSVFAALIVAFTASLTPPAPLSVATWAEDVRHIGAESGSPFAGKWTNTRLPYLVEPMECLSPEHPSTDVTVMFGAQSGKTEIGLNFFGYNVDHDPAPMLIVLPSIDEAQKFVRTKLQPAIDATPELAKKVLEVKSRDELGSTTSFKRFRGGFAQVTHAGSSKGLQMISVKRTWADEISEFPIASGDRGDPCANIETRTDAWSLVGVKRLWTATPGIKLTCRITQRYEASDQRKFYVQCPSCGAFQVLKFSQLQWESDVAPHRASYKCAAKGCKIEHWQKTAMLAGGRWLKTYPAAGDDDAAPGEVLTPEEVAEFARRPSHGRQPGFWLWQAYSPLKDWDAIVAKHLAAKGKPEAEKTFCQQVLAEAWEESGEAPDSDKLYARREDYPLGFLPPGALVLTGAADVQGDRIEYGVLAWGVGMSSWFVDFGIIPYGPDTEKAWKELDEVIARRYRDSNGRVWPIEQFAVDTGFKTERVKRFCRGRPRVFAIDGHGDDNPLLPSIGRPRRVDVKVDGKIEKAGCMIWPLGNWTLKSTLYAGLRNTISGPDDDGIWPFGTVHLPMAMEKVHCEQLTSEALVTIRKASGEAQRGWRRVPDRRNELLDIWCYARAMADSMKLDRYGAEQWLAVARERGREDETGQPDLASLWAPKPLPADELAQARKVEAARLLAQLNRRRS
jgi:phage terminase large subunit GpA-like protein